ncbi:hypothetical protein NLM23_35775 [Bradyrhizobium cajani]|nr:hypothetical protein [Bradyrhizobium cajani]
MSGKDKQETILPKANSRHDFEAEFMTPFSEPSFYQGDRHTYRRVAIVGTLFCVAFVVISFSLRPQLEETRVAIKADRLVRTAGQAPHTN